MNRILVFGADGMLGSALMRQLKKSGSAEVVGTSLSGPSDVENVDVTSTGSLERAFAVASPTVAINCAGVVKSETKDEDSTWAVNADAPHTMSRVAHNYGCRLIHISTDCVFNGQRGNYHESYAPDAEDVYGQSKAAGESVCQKLNCTVIRTSFIGRDPRRRRGLLEWLLRSDSDVTGFVNARWSGLSAPELARVIERVTLAPEIVGLYNVAGPVITKSDLLKQLVQSFGLKIRVSETETPVIDRTLDGTAFRDETGYTSPGWNEMAEELINGT